MDGQMTIFDLKNIFQDLTYDRYGKQHKAPAWMHKERCENCCRWARYQTEEQPPSGWGVKGWCQEHSQKTDKCSYCMNYEKR